MPPNSLMDGGHRVIEIDVEGGRRGPGDPGDVGRPQLQVGDLFKQGLDGVQEPLARRMALAPDGLAGLISGKACCGFAHASAGLRQFDGRHEWRLIDP